MSDEQPEKKRGGLLPEDPTPIKVAPDGVRRIWEPAERSPRRPRSEAQERAIQKATRASADRRRAATRRLRDTELREAQERRDR